MKFRILVTVVCMLGVVEQVGLSDEIMVTPNQTSLGIPISTTPNTNLSADSQPTPWPGVSAALNALNPKPEEVLLDPGCGHDARLLITACRFFGTEQAIGIEINPELAASARQHVAQAGLTDRIQILTGDSTKMDIEADVAVAYMWPEFLTKFRPRLERLKRFVSYGFAVPGLAMTTRSVSNGGMVYLWNRPTVISTEVVVIPKIVSIPVIQVPLTKTVQRIVQLPRGSYCQVCERNCSNPMAHMNIEVAVPQSIKQNTGYWTTRKVCVNGVCHLERVWQEN